ncbi:MAG TPA: hypothetical protein VGS10_08940 [Terracidiphilus sp.]|nr:hypothetical protein [Terracidiphilus sp.]
MADEEKIGKPWRDDELDAIVADYFDMLSADLAGRSYVKSRHSAALMARIGRTHRSVEFKHQNISAVLDELGMPWIPGYIPKRNYQNAIFDAIDRYLSSHQEVSTWAPPPPASPAEPSAIFVDAPFPAAAGRALPARLERLVRKFDPVERDHRNRSLGKQERGLYLRSNANGSPIRTVLICQRRCVGFLRRKGTALDTIFFRLTATAVSVLLK